MKNYNEGEKVSIKRCYEVHINGYITDVCPGEVGTVHWDCGDTVEVYFGDYIMLEVNKEDIEPYISEDAEEVTIDGWVARDDEDLIGESGLYLYPVKPVRKGHWFALPEDVERNAAMRLDVGLFPSLTWESDPLEVTITIKPKKQ